LTFAEFLGVRRLLAAGRRHVEIARELDLGVWTVDRIAARLRYDEDPETAELPQDDAPADYAPENLRRCPRCGAMVYVWPCLACRLAVGGGEEGIGSRLSKVEGLSRSDGNALVVE
jgi:hypothetical protein